MLCISVNFALQSSCSHIICDDGERSSCEIGGKCRALESHVCDVFLFERDGLRVIVHMGK